MVSVVRADQHLTVNVVGCCLVGVMLPVLADILVTDVALSVDRVHNVLARFSLLTGRA